MHSFRSFSSIWRPGKLKTVHNIVRSFHFLAFSPKTFYIKSSRNSFGSNNKYLLRIPPAYSMDAVIVAQVLHHIWTAKQARSGSAQCSSVNTITRQTWTVSSQISTLLFNTRVPSSLSTVTVERIKSWILKTENRLSSKHFAHEGFQSHGMLPKSLHSMNIVWYVIWTSIWPLVLPCQPWLFNASELRLYTLCILLETRMRFSRLFPGTARFINLLIKRSVTNAKPIHSSSLRPTRPLGSSVSSCLIIFLPVSLDCSIVICSLMDHSWFTSFGPSLFWQQLISPFVK